MYDNITQIASLVDSHELVVDEYKSKEDASEEDQRKTRESWARLSGSAVWLPDQQVYFVVTRVIFYAQGNRAWPFMSWLRGQVFDEDWNHLENHTITWKNTTHTFPLVFDIPADYKKGSIFYGPEDPRVIIEEGVADAEPVIIYNMVSEKHNWFRMMHMYRPFSKRNMALTMPDIAEAEKNWAPFFKTAIMKDPNTIPPPSDHIHFVHNFQPLIILACRLVDGSCEEIFNSGVSGAGYIRGGTNWMPIPMDAGEQDMRAWVSFPRTMVEKVCGERFYRPEFAVMVNTGHEFYMAFVSEPTGFGSAIFSLEPGENPCEKGRIMTPNSIARWQTGDGQEEDVMTITLSVNDATVQIVRVKGLLDLVDRMPVLQALLEKTEPISGDHHDALHRRSRHLLGCVLESARANADDTRLGAGRPLYSKEHEKYLDDDGIEYDRAMRIVRLDRERADLLHPVEHVLQDPEDFSMMDTLDEE